MVKFQLKPGRPNGRNISTLATMLGATCCARLATLLRRVSTCWVLLAQIWNWSIFHPTLVMSVIVCLVHATMLHPGMLTSSIFATWCPNARNVLRSTMLRYVVLICCDRLAWACEYWANNVAICCVDMLPSFGLNLRILSQQCCDMLWWYVAIVWPGLNKYDVQFGR